MCIRDSNDTVIDPDLVKAVNDTKQPIFIDRFGQQTTKVPDDNYFLEGKGSALYKLDDLQQQVPSQSANIKGAQSTFDFGEEGDKLVEVVTDPMQFNATREAGLVTGSNVYWGKNFLTLNVDNGDQPVNIELETLLGEYQPVLKTLKKMGDPLGLGALIDNLEGEIEKAVTPLLKGGSILPPLDLGKDDGGLESTGYVFIGEPPDSEDDFDVEDENGQREFTTVKLIRDDIEDLL